MRPPIRKVCGGCLRSVEVSSPGTADGEASSISECPHCGAEIESGSCASATSGEDSERTEPGVSPPSFTSSSNETIDWAETWTRGNLGTMGRFQLRERLGEGGFGQVFQAFDPRLDRDVALKVLKQPNPSERVMQRFFREARAAARLDHPNIVSVHDAGVENGRCWIAYQYVSGRPLWWYRNHHPLDFPTAARIVRELADALDHAHRMGVLHRDLKPANVIMDDQGHPRLTDFGLARRADLDSDLTLDGAMVGTPAYMSPEQAQGQSRNVDERSDVYGLGVIFHEILYGRRPEEAAKEGASSSASASTSVDRKSDRQKRRSERARTPVPAALHRICEKALAAKPEQRYPNARVLVDEIDRWLLQNRDSRFGSMKLLIPARLGAALSLLTCAGLIVAATAFRQRAPQVAESTAPASLTATSLPEAPQALVGKSDLAAEPTPAQTLPRPAAPMLPKEVKSTAPFVANRETMIYHRHDASCVKHMADRNRIPLESVAKADEHGYRPCDKCFRE